MSRSENDGLVDFSIDFLIYKWNEERRLKQYDSKLATKIIANISTNYVPLSMILISHQRIFILWMRLGSILGSLRITTLLSIIQFCNTKGLCPCTVLSLCNEMLAESLWQRPSLS
jgi:hypothetical protein